MLTLLLLWWAEVQLVVEVCNLTSLRLDHRVGHRRLVTLPVKTYRIILRGSQRLKWLVENFVLAKHLGISLSRGLAIRGCLWLGWAHYCLVKTHIDLSTCFRWVSIGCGFDREPDRDHKLLEHVPVFVVEACSDRGLPPHKFFCHGGALALVANDRGTNPSECALNDVSVVCPAQGC